MKFVKITTTLFFVVGMFNVFVVDFSASEKSLMKLQADFKIMPFVAFAEEGMMHGEMMENHKPMKVDAVTTASGHMEKHEVETPEVLVPSVEAKTVEPTLLESPLNEMNLNLSDVKVETSHAMESMHMDESMHSDMTELSFWDKITDFFKNLLK